LPPQPAFAHTQREFRALLLQHELALTPNLPPLTSRSRRPSSPAAAEPAAFRAVDAGAAPMSRPELINYNPVADPAAVVVSSDGLARFTVLTPRLIRMEQRGAASAPGAFEDRSTIAMMNRNLPVPPFTQSVAAGVLTIATASVKVSYTVGQPFSAASLSVTSLDAASAFTSWTFGAPSPGNLLGTIRGLDEQSDTTLNCTLNKGVDDNGEFNHCEFGVVSRDGWVAYDDSINFALDENDWWAPAASGSRNRTCVAPLAGTDTTGPSNSAAYPQGTTVADVGGCCAACLSDPTCVAGYVFDTAADSPNCWPLSGSTGSTSAPNRSFSPFKMTQPTNADAVDLYFFAHGHDYLGALQDFVSVSGKTIMTPRYTSGVWWSRWYDVGNFDLKKIVADYESRDIPLDVFVIDMDVSKSAKRALPSRPDRFALRRS
jgi:alpha-glucosidase (family GH31 glycosyl hydrolase)